MILTAGGNRYTLHFRHIQDGHGRRTEALIHVGACPAHPCAEGLHGVAACHPNDSFSRAKGRKVAMRRAMQEVPRDIRTEIWQAYFEQVKL